MSIQFDEQTATLPEWETMKPKLIRMMLERATARGLLTLSQFALCMAAVEGNIGLVTSIVRDMESKQEITNENV